MRIPDKVKPACAGDWALSGFTTVNHEYALKQLSQKVFQVEPIQGRR